MRRLLLSSFLLLATSLPAQAEWVVDGAFDTGLTQWALGGGYSVNPGLEASWDTTGLGASNSFGVNAGGQVWPPPFPPNWIEQQIVVVQGLTYEFRCDASGARPASPTIGNADTGTIWVEVAGVEVARHAFGNYNGSLPQPQVKRAQVCGRFSPTTSGLVTLRINFTRDFLCNPTTPRMNVDNISVRDVVGPTYCIQGNRQLGDTVQHVVEGEPNALFGTFAALAPFPAGITFPGVVGTLYLDPNLVVVLQIASLDGAGRNATPVPIPVDPNFLGFPIYHQAGMIGTGASLGHDFVVLASQ